MNFTPVNLIVSNWCTYWYWSLFRHNRHDHHTLHTIRCSALRRAMQSLNEYQTMQLFLRDNTNYGPLTQPHSNGVYKRVKQRSTRTCRKEVSAYVPHFLNSSSYHKNLIQKLAGLFMNKFKPDNSLAKRRYTGIKAGDIKRITREYYEYNWAICRLIWLHRTNCSYFMYPPRCVMHTESQTTSSRLR